VNIDISSYNKQQHYPINHGYDRRDGTPVSLVIHSTSSSKKNTRFEAEANYLYQSNDVSAHYLIGKSGQIVQFLAPLMWSAWHAGAALPHWQNERSIGIELHHSVDDPPYPKAQLDALTWLAKDIMARYHLAANDVETHGQIALPGPYDRKHDPHNWPHDDFLVWRATLTSSQFYRTKYRMAVYEQRKGRGPAWGTIEANQIVSFDATGYPEGTAHLATGEGFVMMDDVERI
jgi:N-acetyl-anhydromuramyl-L-alanine amidase AmpD